MYHVSFVHYFFLRAEVERLSPETLPSKAIVLSPTDWTSWRRATVFDQNPNSLFHFGNGNVWYPDLSCLGNVQFSKALATLWLLTDNNSWSNSSFSV